MPQIRAQSEIGYDTYYLAKQAGWVLYVERRSDLVLLRALACRTRHLAARLLQRPFFQLVGDNDPCAAKDHFDRLKEGAPALMAVGLFDLRGFVSFNDPSFRWADWRGRELVGQCCTREHLWGFAKAKAGELLGLTDQEEEALKSAVEEIEAEMWKLGKRLPWEFAEQASDEFLMPLLDTFVRNANWGCKFGRWDFYDFALGRVEREPVERGVKALDAIVSLVESAGSLSWETATPNRRWRR